MQLALVKGSMTSTVKHESLHGKKLLVCQPLSNVLKAGGDPLVVVDLLGAGEGDVVMISSDGKGISERVGNQRTPARWFTLGILDRGRIAVAV